MLYEKSLTSQIAHNRVNGGDRDREQTKPRFYTVGLLVKSVIKFCFAIAAVGA